MTVLYGVLVVLHLLGMAGIVGGWMVAVRQPRILDAMVVGSLVSLVTGLLLVGLSYPVFDGETVDNAKITVKLVVALTVAVLVWVNRNRDAVPRGLLHGIGLLAVANVAVAVLWDDRFLG
jgi:hypothetical protein